MKASTRYGVTNPTRSNRRTLVVSLVVSLITLVFAAPVRTSAQLSPLDPPDIGCQVFFSDALILSVCGGGWGGAPNGFVIQWQKQTDRVDFGWPDNGATPSPSFCEATFTGDQYHLMMGQCISLQFGKNPISGPGVTSTCTNAEPLLCNTEYVFRSKALGGPTMSESGWIGDLRCSTDYNCNNPGPSPGTGGEGEGCTLTQGYWKNHPNAWPVTTLTLGTVSYSQSQLLQILNRPVRGNGLVSLAHQLIAAKLNVANGANGTAVAQTIANADALIGNLVVPPVGNGSLSPSSTSSLTGALGDFNEGTTGPGHCD